MGWWTNGYGEPWGDGPADIIDSAIDAIVKEFQEAEGRKPTADEIRHGLDFSLGVYDE